MFFVLIAEVDLITDFVYLFDFGCNVFMIVLLLSEKVGKYKTNSATNIEKVKKKTLRD